MKRLCYIVLSVLLTLPMVAQTTPPTPAAGYDFYFTLFDHWNENGNAVIQTNKYCGFTVCTIEAGDLTLSVPSSTGDKIFHFDTYNNLAGSLRNVNDAVLQGVHFHSTAACYLHVWVHSGTSGAETMILPKHLLGTKYMVQGVQGNSQFTVVGTENYTNVVITPKVPLRCVSRNNAIIPAGRPSGLYLQENEVLLFQPDDYTNDVSGTLVESDKVVAVFQGNTLTRIPATAEELDFVWEQALPTDTWGKEFIVPLSTRLVNNIYRITALYDDTDVYLYGDFGGKTLVTTLNAGETYERTLHTPLQELQIHHIETSQPTCCHLYTTGADINNNVGDPSMVQITPVDNMAKDTRWMLEQVENNSPWRFSLLVTTRLQDEANVKYNNIPLSSFQQDDGGAVSRMEKDGFVTYEIGISAYTASKMIAESGAGFSAYILRIGKTSEASAFNISLPACTTTPVLIEAPDTVCVDTKNIFRALFANDGSLPEPLEYQWYFSTDSLTWTPLTEGTESELKLKAKPRHTGWYKVAIAGSGDIDNEQRRSVSEPFKFFVIEDCPPILCPEGILIHDEARGDESTYSADLTDLCEHMDLSFIVNLQPNHPENRLLLRLTDIDTEQELAAYDTGDIPADSLQVGTTFTVPVGISNIRWTIRNNESGASGTPLYLSDVETRLCLEPISISNIDDPACRKQPYSFHAEYENYDILRNPEYQWYYCATQDGAYTEIDGASELVYTIDTVHKYHEGWYKVAVSETGWMAYSKCRSVSEPFHLETQYCNTAVEQYWDTTACDTLLAYSLAWREHIWSTAGSVVDTLTDIDDDDSMHVHKTLRTKICCPDIQYITIDSAVCDTLMPFLWFFRDTMLLYEHIGTRELEYRHHRWENCTGEVITLTLDTFHCERLYPIIVNKYNWQLLLDYPALRRFFPDRQFLVFQWYKNGEPIPGATGDDYSEQNELCGVFQLQIQLDQAVDNDDQYIWSTILEIGEPQAPLPVTKRIYNWSGMLVNEEPMRRGLYLIVYRQGDKTWTEKKIVL